jgi:flagellar protein FlaH
MHGALNSGVRCAFYTTENTTRSFLRQMDSLSLDVTDFFLLGALNIYPVPAAMGPESALTAFDTMVDHFNRLYGKFDVIFVDSLTSFVSQVPDASTLNFLTGVKELCDQNVTIFLTIHSAAFDEQMFMRMRSLCDAHLKLRVEEMGELLVKVIEVAKVRGAQKTTGNIITFDVDPGLGMKIIPIAKAKA